MGAGRPVISALIVWRIDALVDRFLIPDGFTFGFLIRLLITGVLFLVIVMVCCLTKLPEVRTIGASFARLPGGPLLPRRRHRRRRSKAGTEVGQGARITEGLTGISGMSGMAG